jgi:lipid A 3-O-deacylase
MIGVSARIANCLGPALLGFLTPAHGTEPNVDRERTLAIGVFAHDRGFASDHHEDGVDLNLEVQFAPLDVFGSPRPHLGATLNFVGDTSMAYAGLGFRMRETPRFFADLHLSAALHDGPLHKDPVGCKLYSDCGYGIRVMPRIGIEIGYRIGPVTAVSVLYDHMSHKWIIGGENEGLDHVGMRFLRGF